MRVRAGTEAKTKAEITVEDLYRVPDGRKAEIVDGEIVLMSPTQRVPNIAAGRIFASLDAYAQREANGYAFTDNMSFIVNLPGRGSFSPDAAYYLGEPEGGPDEYITGAPTFAAEVRSSGDYGSAAERKLARKRADYFAAGTLVVWDVDVLKELVVGVYKASDPQNPTVYGKGESAEAEPAVPGWRMPVDHLLPRI
jgi:Uma2 family endonuclease